MGKPTRSGKRNRKLDSNSDSSLSGTPKRTCSEGRNNQRQITEFTTSGNSDEKLNKVLDGVAELKGVPKQIQEVTDVIELLRGEVLELSCKNEILQK